MKILSCLIVFALISAPSVFAGSMKTYYENGKVQMEMSDKGMKTYYENGQLQSETSLQNGQPAGVTKMYFETGN